MKHLFTLAMLFISLIGYGQTYTNPITLNDAADPSVIKAQDGYYYLYATEGFRGVPVFRSEDMVDWRFVGTAFTESGLPTFCKGNIWAPDVNYINGKYVMYYAISEWGKGNECGIGVAYSDSPVGPFKDMGQLLSSNPESPKYCGIHNSIDPSFFQDDDGKKYLVWGSFYSVGCIQLTDDGLALAEDPIDCHILVVKTGSDIYGRHSLEAPYIKKHDGYYYLIGSRGSTIDDSNPSYHILAARSESLYGTYKNINNYDISLSTQDFTTILDKNSYHIGLGHSSAIIEDEEGQEWIYYHGYPKENGKYSTNCARRLYLSKVTWDGKGGFIKIEAPDNKEHDVPATAEPREYIEIANAKDLQDFARSRQTDAKLRFTADIDMSEVTQTQLGTDSKPFTGEIDGQGHRLLNMKKALILAAGGGCYIHDLIVDKSSNISGSNYTAAFVNRGRGVGHIRFVRCGNEADINGTGVNSSAFFGCNLGSIAPLFSDCYNTGNIKGSKECCVFSGWGCDAVFNSWNTGIVTGLEENTESNGERNNSLTRGMDAKNYHNTWDLCADNKPINANVLANYNESWLADGHLCYQMNASRQLGVQPWMQWLGNDEHPVIAGHKVHVYYNSSTKQYYNKEEEFPVDIVPGDANGDGSVTVADLTLMASYILTGNSAGVNVANADTNGDGSISVADLTSVANMILGN